MEKTVDTPAVRTVTTIRVTDLMDGAFFVVQTGSVENYVMKVKILFFQIVKDDINVIHVILYLLTVCKESFLHLNRFKNIQN